MVLLLTQWKVTKPSPDDCNKDCGRPDWTIFGTVTMRVSIPIILRRGKTHTSLLNFNLYFECVGVPPYVPHRTPYTIRYKKSKYKGV